MTHPDDTTYEEPLAPELQELALALRADAPEPDPAFAERLRGRVQAGFPRDDDSIRSRAPRRALRMLPATAALATVVLVGLALSSIGTGVQLRGGDDAADGGGGDGGGASVAPLEDAGGGSEGAGGGSQGARDRPAFAAGQPSDLPGSGFAPGRRDRKIEHSISMTLEAPDEEIPEVADRVTEVTNRHGGFVLRSNLDSDDEGASGSFELRIPAARLREALGDLAGLATVRSQSQSGQDVTREHVTARDRLEAARAERRSLLRRLELAATDVEAEAIRRRLDIVAGEINGLRAQLRDLRLRTDYAIVTVDLAGTEGDSGSGASGSLDDAVGDAGDLLVGLTGALIRILAIALPLGLIALAGWVAGRGLRRRRRESVLA
jgi:hypothetical protein